MASTTGKEQAADSHTENVPPYTALWKEGKLYMKPAGWADLHSLVVAFGVECEDLSVNPSTFSQTAYKELSQWLDHLQKLAYVLSDEDADHKLKQACYEIFTPVNFISARNPTTGVDLARMPLGKLKVAAVATFILNRLHFALNKIFSVRYRFGDDADIDQLLFDKQYMDDMPDISRLEFRFADGHRLVWEEYSDWVAQLVQCYKSLQGMPLSVHEAFGKATEASKKELDETRSASGTTGTGGSTSSGTTKYQTKSSNKNQKPVYNYDPKKAVKNVASKWKPVAPVDRSVPDKKKEQPKEESKDEKKPKGKANKKAEKDKDGFETVKRKGTKKTVASVEENVEETGEKDTKETVENSDSE